MKENNRFYKNVSLSLSEGCVYVTVIGLLLRYFGCDGQALLLITIIIFYVP